MTAEQVIDLGTPPFWVAVLVALVVLVPLVHAGVRGVAIAAVDLTVACLFVGARGAPVMLGLVAVAFVVCRLLALRSVRAFAVVAGAGALVAAFVIHKERAPHVLSIIGFSYVTLRAIELGRAVAEERHPSPAPHELVSYLLPFHMLAAGPIQAYDDFRAQPAVPAPLTVEVALAAMERIASGLFKKFVIAQSIHAIALTGFTADGPYLLLEAQAHYLWVFVDFSAYSDIAVGVGTLLGRATPENFNHPLAARNITEFWERWHISLSTFIRRNLFIPIQLALGRKLDGARPLAAASVAIVVSFLLCGLWHGLSLRFLAWGALHAAALVATNLYRHALQAKLGRKGVKTYLARPVVRAIATVLTFEFVAFSLAFIVYPF